MTAIVLGILGALGLGAAAFEGLYRRRDAGTIGLDAVNRSAWQPLPASPGERRFACRIEFANANRRYEQTLVDVRPSVRLLAKDGVDPEGLGASVRVRLSGAEGRTDGYWAANLLGPGERAAFELSVRLTGPEADLERLHAAVVTVAYSTYGRRDHLFFDEEIVLPLSAVAPLPPFTAGATCARRCVPSPILTDRDDIVEVVDRLTAGFRRPGDVVAIAESVVAITQRQYFRPQEVKVGYLARRLCYFVPSKGSLSSPHGYQLAMNQVGTFRMVASFVVGALGKAVGKKGLFYALAGKPAELIDDITGTMPPFDKYIVAGPKDPQGLVDRLKATTGLEAAIVDANDLKRVMVLAHTAGVTEAALVGWLLDNPFGNAAEQTPIVLLRPGAPDAQGGESLDQSCSV